eukprot:1606379-Rhodomonas_salina.4
MLLRFPVPGYTCGLASCSGQYPGTTTKLQSRVVTYPGTPGTSTTSDLLDAVELRLRAPRDQSRLLLSCSKWQAKTWSKRNVLGAQMTLGSSLGIVTEGFAILSEQPQGKPGNPGLGDRDAKSQIMLRDVAIVGTRVPGVHVDNELRLLTVTLGRLVQRFPFLASAGILGAGVSRYALASEAGSGGWVLHGVPPDFKLE